MSERSTSFVFRSDLNWLITSILILTNQSGIRIRKILPTSSCTGLIRVALGVYVVSVEFFLILAFSSALPCFTLLVTLTSTDTWPKPQGFQVRLIRGAPVTRNTVTNMSTPDSQKPVNLYQQLPKPPEKTGKKKRRRTQEPTFELKSLVALPSDFEPSEPLEGKLQNRILQLDRNTIQKKKTAIVVENRRSAGKLNIPKDEQKYALYEPLATLWSTYARSVLTENTKNLGDRVLRMDLHGAIVEVVRSKDPGLVGKKGILVAETANTVLLVTKQDRVITIPKSVAVIRFVAGKHAVELMLPALTYRASERSARKIKKCRPNVLI